MTEIYRKFNVESRSFSTGNKTYSGQENDSLSATLHFTYDPIDFLKDGEGFYYIPYIIFDVMDENGNPLMYGPSAKTSQPVFDGYTFSIPWDVTSRVKSSHVGYQLFFLRNDVVFDPYRDNVATLDTTQYILSPIDGIAIKPSISCKSHRNPCACPPMTPHSEPSIVGYINLWKDYGVVTPIASGINEDGIVVLKFHTYSGDNESEVVLDNIPALVDGKILVNNLPTGHTVDTIPLLKGEISNGKSIMYDETKGGFVEYEIEGIYQFRGTCTSIQLDEMSASGTTLTGDKLVVGMVYSLTDERVYEGETFKAGTNWVWSEDTRWEPLTVGIDLSGYQKVDDRVIGWAEPTDEQYPSAKLTKDSLDGKLDRIQKVDAWTEIPSENNIPSERLVKTDLDTKLDDNQLTTVWTSPVPLDSKIPSEKLVKDALARKTDKNLAIPKWDETEEYFQGSTVVASGTETIYISRESGNIGHSPLEPESIYWVEVKGTGGGGGGGSSGAKVIREDIFGNGSKKDFVIDHQFKTYDFFYQIRANNETKDYVDVKVSATSANSATISFRNPPLEGESYKVILSPGVGSGGGGGATTAKFIVGDGLVRDYTFKHGMKSRDFTWSIRQNSAPYKFVQAEVSAPTEDDVKISFEQIPGKDEFTLILVFAN